MVDGTLELVQERDARWARTLHELQTCCLAGRRAWAKVARIARKHEAVDCQRLLTRRKELGEPHAGWGVVYSVCVKDVVLWDGAAWWQLAPGNGDRLHGAP